MESDISRCMGGLRGGGQSLRSDMELDGSGWGERKKKENEKGEGEKKSKGGGRRWTKKAMVLDVNSNSRRWKVAGGGRSLTGKPSHTEAHLPTCQ